MIGYLTRRDLCSTTTLSSNLTVHATFGGSATELFSPQSLYLYVAKLCATLSSAVLIIGGLVPCTFAFREVDQGIGHSAP
jgi:hypothetical protein